MYFTIGFLTILLSTRTGLRLWSDILGNYADYNLFCIKEANKAHACCILTEINSWLLFLYVALVGFQYLFTYVFLLKVTGCCSRKKRLEELPDATEEARMTITAQNSFRSKIHPDNSRSKSMTIDKIWYLKDEIRNKEIQSEVRKSMAAVNVKNSIAIIPQAEREESVGLNDFGSGINPSGDIAPGSNLLLDFNNSLVSGDKSSVL